MVGQIDKKFIFMSLLFFSFFFFSFIFFQKDQHLDACYEWVRKICNTPFLSLRQQTKMHLWEQEPDFIQAAKCPIFIIPTSVFLKIALLILTKEKSDSLGMISLDFSPFPFSIIYFNFFRSVDMVALLLFLGHRVSSNNWLHSASNQVRGDLELQL